MESKKILFFVIGLLYAGSCSTAQEEKHQKKSSGLELTSSLTKGNPFRPTIEDQNNFFTACLHGNIPTIEKLLASKNIVLDQPKEFEGEVITPLIAACMNNQTTAVQTLLAYDSTAKKRFNNRTKTSPSLDAKKGFPFSWQGLRRSIKVDTQLNEESASEYFHSSDSVDVNKEVKTSNGETITSLSVACSNKYTEMVKILINDENIDIHKGQINANGTTITPLAEACLNKDTETVKALIDHTDIDVNKGEINVDGSTVTPLGIACFKKDTETAKLLLEKNPSLQRAHKRYNAYQVDSDSAIKELIKKHALKNISADPVDPITLEKFQDNEKLHFLECCCNFITSESYDLLRNRGNSKCPRCNSCCLTPVKNEATYKTEDLTTQVEVEEPLID